MGWKEWRWREKFFYVAYGEDVFMFVNIVIIVIGKEMILG